MSLIKYENVAATLLLAKDVNDDMIVEELSIDTTHSQIQVSGHEYDVEGNKYQVKYSISIIDISDESEQESLQPIVTKT